MIVSIKRVLLELRMSRDVNLRNPLGGHTVHVVERIKAVILGRHINIVDVKQNPAVRCFNDFIQKLPLRDLGLVRLRIATNVFDCDRNFKEDAALRGYEQRWLSQLQKCRALEGDHACIDHPHCPNTGDRRAKGSSCAE